RQRVHDVPGNVHESAADLFGRDQLRSYGSNQGDAAEQVADGDVHGRQGRQAENAGRPVSSSGHLPAGQAPPTALYSATSAVTADVRPTASSLSALSNVRWASSTCRKSVSPAS